MSKLLIIRKMKIKATLGFYFIAMSNRALLLKTRRYLAKRVTNSTSWIGKDDNKRKKGN